MTTYPHAQWRPLADQQPARMTRHDLVILHTMVGSLWGTDAYFRQGGYGGTESHFGVGGDGTVLQWTDLDCRADANYEANHRAISIETADKGEDFPAWSGSNVPAWTPQQVEAIARIVAWCCARYDIPCVLVPDSRPGRRGIGYHRQGIDPWRVSGGEQWSTSAGKVCPGNRRIAQVPAVIDRARAILAGEDDDMSAEAEKMIKTLHDHVMLSGHKDPDGDPILNIKAGQLTVGGSLMSYLGEIKATTNALAIAVNSLDLEFDDVRARVGEILAAVLADDDLPGDITAEQVADLVIQKLAEALAGKGDAA